MSPAARAVARLAPPSWGYGREQEAVGLVCAGAEGRAGVGARRGGAASRVPYMSSLDGYPRRKEGPNSEKI